MEMQPYIVYVKTDEQNRITAVHSSAFLADTAGWTAVDSGYGDRFHHAQGNYFDKPLYDERGVCRYKLEGGHLQERTQTEMDADVQAFPQEDSNEVLLLELAADHEYRICLLEMGIEENEVRENDV